MPSNCWDCPCHNGDMQFCQFFMDREDDYDYMLEEDIDHNRRENCPLREVTPPINDILEALINEQQETIDK